MFALVIGHKGAATVSGAGNCAVILNEATRTLKCKTYLPDFLFRLFAVCIFILQMYFMCDIAIICVTESQWNLVEKGNFFFKLGFCGCHVRHMFLCPKCVHV